MIPNAMVSAPELMIVVLRSLADHGLVFCRLLGLLALIPGISNSALSWQLRGILLLTLAGVITPNVSHDAHSVLTGNAIAQISFEQPAVPGIATIDRDAERGQRDDSTPKFPDRSWFAWIHLASAELCLGVLLGAGANLVLQGFRMAGALIEQQLGLSIASNNLSSGESEATGTGELFFWLGGALFLIAGGHLLFISTLLDTFRQFPVAYGEIDRHWGEVVVVLVHQSFKLALQLAAPIVATQILASTILSHAGAAAPQFNSLGVTVPLRFAAACLILVLTLSGLTDRLLESIPAMLSASVPLDARS